MIQQMLGIWSLVPLAFSKTSLNNWKFVVHVLLKPGLENFENYFASVWDECNCAVVWAFLALPFFGIEMETDIFLSCGHCWIFQISWHIECSPLTASSFGIWNRTAGIPSPPLVLFVVMLPKAYLTSHSRMSGFSWVTTALWISGSLRPFCIVLLCFYLFNLLLLLAMLFWLFIYLFLLIYLYPGR